MNWDWASFAIGVVFGLAIAVGVGFAWFVAFAHGMSDE